MPFDVYILYSTKIRKTYVGLTSNLEARIKSHNVSSKGWTIRGRPWILLHSEAFNSKAQAMAREKELKSGKGRTFIKDFVVKKFMI